MYLPLDVPACPVSLLAGSGNFHGNTKKACTDQSLFVWRPFVQSVNTMLYTVTGWLPQESFQFTAFHFALYEDRVRSRGSSRTDRPRPLHLDAAWQITLLPNAAFLSRNFQGEHTYCVVISLCGICLQTHKLSKLQLHWLVVQVTVYNFHNHPCARVWLKQTKSHTSRHKNVCKAKIQQLKMNSSLKCICFLICIIQTRTSSHLFQWSFSILYSNASKTFWHVSS